MPQTLGQRHVARGLDISHSLGPCKSPILKLYRDILEHVEGHLAVTGHCHFAAKLADAVVGLLFHLVASKVHVFEYPAIVMTIRELVASDDAREVMDHAHN